VLTAFSGSRKDNLAALRILSAGTRERGRRGRLLQRYSRWPPTHKLGIDSYLNVIMRKPRCWNQKTAQPPDAADDASVRLIKALGGGMG